MTDRMKVGHDLDLLLDAARLVISRRTWSGRPFKVITQNTVQRHVRVGFVKAGRLLLLMEDFGIVSRSGAGRFDCAIEAADLDAKLAEIRTAHAGETVDG